MTPRKPRISREDEADPASSKSDGDWLVDPCWAGSDPYSADYWTAAPDGLPDARECVFITDSSTISASGNRLLYRASDGGSLPTVGASQPVRSSDFTAGEEQVTARRQDDNDCDPTGPTARMEEKMLTTQKAARHASLVESAVQGLKSSDEIDHRVRHSWTRCIENYALDPQAPKQATVVDRPELQARREQHALLLGIARVELLNLRKRLNPNDFGIMLTDQDGVILHYVGDPGFASTAKRSGLREGAVWSER